MSNLHIDDPRSKNTQTLEELEKIEVESEKQKLPEQQAVFKADSIKDRAKKRGVSNLPNRLNPPMGFDKDKAYDNVGLSLKKCVAIGRFSSL